MFQDDEIEVSIPHRYVWLTEGLANIGTLFKRYVTGYIKSNYPELDFVRIEGMKAICKRK